MQGFAKKTKKELEGYPLKYFVVEGSTLEDCRKIITTHIQEKLSKMIIHNIKVLVV